jgi:[ribosomal protein S18]-alanine N-acetyltransferase
LATIDQGQHQGQIESCTLSTGEQLTIEPANVGDLFAIANLQRACFERGQAYGAVTLLMFQIWPKAHLLVARFGERVAGCVIGDVQREQARILNICVDPRIRRRGLGSALLSAIESALDHDNLTLMVEDKNFTAQALYQRHGFLQAGDLRDYYGRNRHGVLMQKRRPKPEPGYRPSITISDYREDDPWR